MTSNKVRIIALYLPQFHPTPENDQWWGKGFTEWVNTAKARPLFKGHQQPNIPKDLGFYDLRLLDTQIAQSEIAIEHGVEGFMYWHYWFGNGTRMLEKPFLKAVDEKDVRIKFSLAWANESWTNIWTGKPRTILVKQEFPGKKDFEDHFYTYLKAFQDERYTRVNGKLLFGLFHPEFKNSKLFVDTWQNLAQKESLGEFLFMGFNRKRNDDGSQLHTNGIKRFVKISPWPEVKYLPTITDIVVRKLFSRKVDDILNERPDVYNYQDYE